MSLRVKVFSIAAVSTIAAIILIFVVSDAILLRNYDDLDHEHMSQHLDLITIAINEELANLNKVNIDWADWDDTYNFMDDRNSAYVESNLVASIFENLGIDLIMYVDNSGNVVWEGSSSPSGIADIPDESINTLKTSGAPLFIEEEKQSNTGFVTIGGHPLMVVSNPILTSDRQGPSRGFLVWGRYVAQDYGMALSQKMLTDVGLDFPDTWNSDEKAQSALSHLEENDRWIAPVDSSQIAAYESVNDLEGKASFLIKVTAPREYLLNGTSTLNSMILALGAAMAVLGIVLYLMMGRTVVTPLSLLNRAVAGIGVKGNEKHRVPDDGNDEVASLGKAINDTLDRLEDSQKALKKAAEEWRITFDSIDDPISIQDNDYRFMRVNRAFARSYGMEPGDLVGKKCYEIIHGTTAPPKDCAHQEIIKTHRPVTEEYYDAVKESHLEISMAPIIDDDRKMTGMVQITKNVTERKQMESHLIVTDRLASLGEMAAGIAHEINNPLTGIIGFTDMLLESDLPELVKADIRPIAEGSARVAEIVKRMLTFARHTQPLRTRVDINEILNSTLALQTYSLQISNIEIVKEFNPDLPWLVIDPGQMQQVFLNLIINAQYAMKKAHNRGTLTIGTERHGENVRITVADDGPGIPPDVMTKLFQPFFTTKAPGEGTGLGLPLSRSIVLEHGGTLSVKSEPGEGAIFTIELPVTSRDESAGTEAVVVGATA
ncbi:CHASE4 domain-containing protein [Dehalogenimonas etheniformans]|uniref:histidine kinase n=1 Tax=Dehalogenimonas etheniformans TaxID=1536648 RepID=A0A2P5P8Y5_9CHLR|nr:CHASE4 domain-containing protein [Dehalogenimonas etheniformans]PPD58761.1 PAS domain S-box protein [Dehalogenimonas etheniformans]QNT76468.1 PAS domain S-box protein [Dehalogenimonas etheniformans]